MKRTAVRTATVLGLAGYLLVTTGLLAGGAASAARPPMPDTAVSPMGPQAKLPPQLFSQSSVFDKSAAPLHSPLLSDPLGRKFK